MAIDIDAIVGTSGVWGSIELPRLPNFQLPSINLRSLDGFDLPSLFRLLFPSLPSNTSSWDLSLFLELPQIRGLLGKFLALRGGRFGLFLSGFFRLDLDMQMFDLGRFTEGSGFNLPDFNLLMICRMHWRIGRGGGTGFGLVRLPYLLTGQRLIGNSHCRIHSKDCLISLEDCLLEDLPVENHLYFLL